MRKEPTPAERRLWKEVRGGAFHGIPFRRQHTIGRFVVDFFTPTHRLAIELDGEIHDSQQEQDALRTEALNDRGIRVIRFRNEEVLSHLDTVLNRLRSELLVPHTDPEA